MGIERSGSWKKALVLSTSIVLLVLGLQNISLKSSFRLLDDGVYWETRDGRVQAKRVHPASPASVAGLRKGDVLVGVGDRTVDTATDIREILDGSIEGQTLTYLVLREQAERALVVSVAPLPRGNVGAYYFLAALGIFSLIVGTVVYMRRRGVAATAHFYLLCVFWYLAFAFSPTGKFDAWDTAYYWMDRVGLLFFPPLFLHFALCFPERKQFVEKNKWVLPLLYVPSFLFIHLSLLGSLVFFTNVSWGDRFFVFSNQLLDRLVPAYVSAMSLAAFAAFVNSHHNARTITVKKQTKWIVWGTGFGTTPFALFYAIPYLMDMQPSLPAEFSVVPLALIPLSFAYAIVKYRLMDVEVIFKRGVVYTLATSAVVLLYFALFILGTNYFVGDTYSTIIALAATMVVVLLFSPIKSRIQVAIDRLFYRESFDYRRALREFSRDLNSHLDLDRLSARLVERIRDTFEVENVALLVPGDDRGDLEVLAGDGLTGQELGEVRIMSDSLLFARLTSGEPVYHGEIDVDSYRTTPVPYGDTSDGLLMVDGFQYAIPCLIENRVVGVILLGRRWSQSALSSEDMELLLTLSGQAATAIENARLYRSLELKAEQFERLKEHSENTIESLDAGILVLDLFGKVVRWNKALEKLYGVSREDALGRTVSELFPAPFHDVLSASMGRDWWSRAESTDVSRMNLLNRRGEDKVVKLQVAPFVSDSGENQGAIMIFEDITTRVEIEQQLQLREKMASLGLLAAGVAHEVNTPLTGISSFTQMLMDQTPEADGRIKLLEKIERQTERASKIVNSLLNFSRQGRTDFVSVDLNVVVNDVLSLLEHQLTRGRIKVRKELEPDLPKILGDENKLQQVFLNLILNGQEAMPSGGWLTLKTSSQGPQVIAEISDTGHGISKEDVKRIYDMFFTTKKAGRSGTGLGLSITYGIIQEHSGNIYVDSAVGKGTSFQIKLPAYDRITAPTPAAVGENMMEMEPKANRVRRR